jgi:S-adenosylmethionine hydrolase
VSGASAPLGAAAVVRVGGRAVARVGTYADLARGAVGALIGSGGRLEIAVRENLQRASAAIVDGDSATANPASSSDTSLRRGW